MATRKATGPRKSAPQPEDTPIVTGTDAPRDEPKAAVRELRANVVIDGKVYGPAHPENVVTDEIAEQITNPQAWA